MIDTSDDTLDPTPAPRRLARWSGLALLLLLPMLQASALRAESPWSVLERLRNSLQEAGPTSGKFVQTYVPAGFNQGDQESGHLSIWLPDCLRWNYEEPAAKSFLVCQGEVYFWNEGETGGRHYKIDPTEEPGLDLLLVPLATLRERYVASGDELPDGTYEVSLSTPPSAAGTFSAKIRVDAAHKQVLGLEYTDEEGNLTHFQITGYTPLRHTALFQPPRDIAWTED